MGEHSFPKVFPYFFPLAVFTLRTIWYIRYILKIDLNLMTPDVVIWQLMDRAKQIRIPHPLPKAPVFERKQVLFSFCFPLLKRSKREKIRPHACLLLFMKGMRSEYGTKNHIKWTVS